MKISTMLYEKSCVDEASLALALKIARENVLTELREWVEVKKIDTFLMNVANRKRAGHINRVLVEIQARIDELINPTN